VRQARSATGCRHTHRTWRSSAGSATQACRASSMRPARSANLATNAPLLPPLATGTSALGIGFGDRFAGSEGRSGSFKEMVQQAEKPAELQGKARYQAPSRHRIAADRSLHGKEGVDGSSPSEGLYKSPANGLMLSSVPTQFGLVAGTRRVHFGTSGHARASAPSRGTSSNVLEAVHRGYSLGKLLQIDGWRCPPRSDADFLLVERGSAQAPTCRQPACHAGGRGFESRRSRSRNATANAGRLQLGAYA
jgi:hypothetical protein